MTRPIRVLILVACITGTGAALPAQAPARFDLEEATIADLQQRMQSGRDTARSLVEKYLARIEQIDRNGPSLHSVLETNPDALTIADALDAERRSHGPRGPLHGIPILIKDNIATADRMMTTAGSLALAGSKPPKDAFIVRRLREAGAIILGKTNLSEWANFRSTHSTSGWSGRGGLTKNPYALDRNPSGSSSGSGAAAAANLCAAAVGTETDGSIVSPSNNNSLVGIKPTLGLVSRSGIVPIAHSQDTAGPMARTVTDAMVLLAALIGSDPDDAATTRGGGIGVGPAGAGGSGPTRWSAPTLDRDALRGARIGVVRNRLFGYSAAADAIAEAAIADMKARGAVIVDPANIPTLGKFDESEFDVLVYEFKADVNKYLAWLGAASPVHSLKDVIAFNDAHKDQELPYFGQEIMLQAEKKGPLTEAKYRTELASNHRMSRALGIDAVMTKYSLDALVAPTGGPAWLSDLVNGDGGTATAPGPSTVTSVAGYPHITVPAGYARAAGRHLIFRPRAERADADQAGVRVRTGDEAPEAADVCGDRRCEAALKGCVSVNDCLRRTLPQCSTDEERTEPLEIQRRLLRFPHHLDDRGERIEILSDQPDDEVVVVLVEAVAREPDIVRVVGHAERHPDGAVFRENDALLFRRQLRELARTPQRVPDRPPPLRIQNRPPGTMEQDVDEVRLVAERICASQHRVFGLLHQGTKRRPVEDRPDAIQKEVRILAERQQRDAARIVHVFVEHAADAGVADGVDEPLAVFAAAEREELHEEPRVAALRLPVLHPALLAQVGRLGTAAGRVRRGVRR